MSHKKRDWSKYNKSLVNRGSLTFWIAPEITKSWEAAAQEKRRGRPFTYADTAIETLFQMMKKHLLNLKQQY